MIIEMRLKMCVEYFLLLLGQGVIKRPHCRGMFGHIFFTGFHVFQHAIKTVRRAHLPPVLMCVHMHFGPCRFLNWLTERGTLAFFVVVSGPLANMLLPGKAGKPKPNKTPRDFCAMFINYLLYDFCATYLAANRTYPKRKL